MAAESANGVAQVGLAAGSEGVAAGYDRLTGASTRIHARPTRGLMFQVLLLPPAGPAASVKRWLDVAGAAGILLILAPVLALIAVLVRIDSPGGVILRQDRIGRDLRPFQMLKFRSMVRDADLMLASLQHMNQANGPLFKIRDDPRMTRVGRVLRRFSLDELPQLVNVVRGDMSLVGPRPPFHGEVALDHLRQRLRLRFTPGMTGLWQVSGRSDLPYEEMLQLDFKYMRTWSPLLDLKILWRTLPAVMGGQGAC
jgi:lipopolysaccharide/colanic/teichoic acid biosynthesis glycosyltransferase